MTAFELGDEVPTPAWVMWGTERPDGTVQIMASRDVTRAAVPWPDLVEDAWGQFPPIELNVTMTKATLTLGADWAEAFARLFRTWSPTPDRTEIDARTQVEGERT